VLPTPTHPASMLGYSSDASRDMLARSELEALQVRPIATHETPIILLLELELEVYYRKIGGGTHRDEL
jgi:hypothetical protein